MIRKLTGIIILGISIGILLLAMDQSFINILKQDRYLNRVYPKPNEKRSLYEKIFLRSDKWDYGDLFGISYLPEYKIKLPPYRHYHRAASEPTTNHVLYITGDSFLADKILDGAFKGYDYVVFYDRRFPFGPITLDSTKQNYLIMEYAEMNIIKNSLPKTPEVRWSAADIKNKLNYSKVPVAGPSAPPDSYLTRIYNILFNKELSRNIETLVFDDKIFTPFKEAKAYLNYHLLGRVPKEVTVSTDKKRLLLTATVDTSKTSDFRELSDGDIDSLDKNLAAAQNYYLSIGFKKVYLAIIPNAVSVYDNQRMRYNHLLERVEKTTTLPVISIYPVFKNQTENLYFLGDVHWNPLGFDIWVKEANKTLKF